MMVKDAFEAASILSDKTDEWTKSLPEGGRVAIDGLFMSAALLIRKVKRLEERVDELEKGAKR